MTVRADMATLFSGEICPGCGCFHGPYEDCVTLDDSLFCECAAEIARLKAEVDRLNTRILNTVHMIDARSTKGQIRLNLTAALDDGKPQ